MINRALGGLETFWAISCEVSPANAVTVFAVRGGLQEPLVRIALDRLQNRHPILRTRLEKIGKKYFLRSDNVPSISLSSDYVATQKDYDAICSDEYDTPFDYARGPFFRVRLVHIAEKPELVYVVTNYLHTIGDGESITNICREMMLICQKIAVGEADFSLPSLPEAPYCEQIFPKRIYSAKGKWRFLGFCARMLREELILRHKRIFPQRNVPASELRTGVLEKIVPDTLAKAMNKLAKSHDANLHGALIAAALLAARQYYAQTTGNKQPIWLKANSLVNLRPYLEPPIAAENYGCYISLVHGLHRVGETTDFWTLAREARNAVVQGVGREDMFSLAMFIAPIARLTVSPLPQKSVALSISNVGQMRWDGDFAPFFVEEYWGNVSNTGGGADISLVVNSFGGKMFWSYTFTQPMVNYEMMDKVASRALEIWEEQLAQG